MPWEVATLVRYTVIVQLWSHELAVFSFRVLAESHYTEERCVLNADPVPRLQNLNPMSHRQQCA